MATIDNYHNSFPTSLQRVQEIARQNLPENPTSDDILSTQVQVFQADLTKEDQVRDVLSKFGHGGLWGVVHIAVSGASIQLLRPGIAGSILFAYIGILTRGCTRRPLDFSLFLIINLVAISHD